MSHTPGPWKIETGEYSGDNWLVGSLYLGRSNDDDKTYWIHITTDRVHASEMGNADAKDDAVLIASAPTLAADLARLQAENEAMREALEGLLRNVVNLSAQTGQAPAPSVERNIKAARAALGGEK